MAITYVGILYIYLLYCILIKIIKIITASYLEARFVLHAEEVLW